MQSAVDAAAAAFPAWSRTSILTKQQVMFRFQQLIRENMGKLAANIVEEQGKTTVDAEGDVLRGLRMFYILVKYSLKFFLEVVEHCCSITSLQLGEALPGVAKDMDIVSHRIPLGVVSGITPFNFPAMVPLWMIPVAITCGNTFVIKPSERDPGACMMLVDLLQQAGCPKGVVNVIHGAHKAVDFICDDPKIKAVSFVGSDQAVIISTVK